MAVIALGATSCKDTKKEGSSADGVQSEHMDDNGHMGDGMEDHSQMDQDNMNQDGMAMMSSEVVADYLTLKNALVSDDKDGAATAGEKLEGSLKDFDTSKFSDEQRAELTDIIEDATEHAEHIAKSDIGHQREHFDILSKDVIDLLAIAGSERTLYQAYCPMYCTKADQLSEGGKGHRMDFAGCVGGHPVYAHRTQSKRFDTQNGFYGR